jgi:hypothetical protein
MTSQATSNRFAFWFKALAAALRPKCSLSSSAVINTSFYENTMNSETVPTFSLAYTSVRPAFIPQVVHMWTSRAAKPLDIEWCIAVDDGDTAAMTAAASCSALALPPEPKCRAVRVMVNNGPKTCVAGWNMAAATTTGKIIIAVADDFNPPHHWDSLLLSLSPRGWENAEHVVHINDGYVQSLCTLAILTRKRYERFGYLWYPKYESMFCLHPKTQVYMGDYSLRMASEVVPGHIVIGVEKRLGKKGTAQAREHLVRTPVEMVSSRIAERFEITTSSGSRLCCTEDHLWGYYADGKLTNYGAAKIGRKLTKVLDCLPEAPRGTERQRGWLAGIFDGGGHFPVITQSPSKNPEVCTEIEIALKALGLGYTTHDFVQRGFVQRVFTLTGGRQAYFQFLNWINPVKRSGKAVDTRMLTSRFAVPDAIVDIKPIGRGQVVCLTTGTKNFIADGFLSHNCDTEFGEVAIRDGVVIEAMHLLFEHLHPDCGKRQRDQQDMKHASSTRWQMGETLFNYRRMQGFPIDDGPKAVKAPTIQPKASTAEGFCAYMQVTRDDLCLLEVCWRMKEEGVSDIFWAEPDEYWSGEPLEPYCAMELEATALEVRKIGINLRRRTFSVKSNRMPGDSRIAVETRVRNDSLHWIRSEGFKKILIVDGDELWKPGTLAAIKPYVDQGHSSVMTYMVPVIGLPGWPVGEAVDTAVVYIGGTSLFKCCRSPLGKFVILPSPLVIHFTGTRRTLEETIRKHTRSGHYDDPDYLFDLWIKDVLPNIKPGWAYRWPNGIEGLHMFTQKQIWPRCREWLPDELAAIPESLHAYLGGLNKSGG